MSKFLSFLSPLASLILGWLSFIFILFFPPLWIFWPILIIGVFIINYLGIRYVLGHRGRARAWHHWFNVGECALFVAVFHWVWNF